MPATTAALSPRASHARPWPDAAAPAAVQPLRVALVTETYPPEVNGVAATVSRVVDGLCQRGHVVELVRPRQGELDTPRSTHSLEELLVRGCPIPRYPQLRMGVPATGRLIQRWTRQRPDVVHLATEGPLGWSALRAALRLQLPVVSEFRTQFAAYSSHYGIAWLQRPITAWLRHFHNRTACTMVPTEALRRALMQDGFERLSVVARGVDTRLFDPVHRSAELRRQWGAGESDIVALCVGRLAPEKNLGLLIKAFEALQARAPSTRLVLVGDGPQRDALLQRCPGAVMAGVQRGQALAAHYASADVFLFPSTTETFGNVVLEAMASGLAVLAYDYAAARQWVQPGFSGLLAPLDDEAAFCTAAGQLAGSPIWRASLGKNSRAAMLPLGWDGIVAQVERVYLDAISASRRTRQPIAVHPLQALSGAEGLPWHATVQTREPQAVEASVQLTGQPAGRS